MFFLRFCWSRVFLFPTQQQQTTTDFTALHPFSIILYNTLPIGVNGKKLFIIKIIIKYTFTIIIDL